jgi:23S rRNA G2069 N7-methylase RlmK/C1962 C5-methylase RlmI
MMRGTVRIKRAKARPFWFGNPVVYSGAIEEVDGSPAGGDLVEVRSNEGKTIGLGFYNPFSSYRVRLVWSHRDGDPPRSIEALLKAQIEKCLSYRKRLCLPSPETTGYRAINSEGDGLSGLVVDVYDRIAVVVENALWVREHRQAIESALRTLLPKIETVVFQTSKIAYALEGVTDDEEKSVGHKEIEGQGQWFLENNIRFNAFVGRGQKTGFYLDQRDNRLFVQTLSKGLRVLDAFSYTGAFGVYSALGGAKEVVCVDSSTPAIEMAKEHARQNGVHTRMRFVTGDALDFMTGEKGSFDLVICDPAGLAPSVRHVDAARKYYLRINEAAMMALRKEGILVTCCCSAPVTRDVFMEIIRDAGQKADIKLHIVKTSGAGLDHPVNPSYPEGDYLKCIVAVCI